MTSERRVLLDLIRTYSAFLVVLTHATEFVIPAKNLRENLFHPIWLLHLGSAAVIAFFFLSGFLVGGGVIEKFVNDTLEWKGYLFDRITRLWIVLIPAFPLIIALNLINCRSEELSRYCSAVWPMLERNAGLPLATQGFQNLIQNMLFTQYLKSEIFGRNVPLWSLSFEFWYYIGFFGLLYLARNLRRKIFKIGFWGSLISLIILSRVVNETWMKLGTIWLFGAIMSRLLIVADRKRIYLRSQHLVVNKQLRFILASTFYFVSLLLIRQNPGPFRSTLILVPALSLILASSSPREELISGRKTVRLISVCASFSFSLYILHFPIIALLANHFIIHTYETVILFQLISILGLVLISVAASYLFAFGTELQLQVVRKYFRTYFD